MEYKEEALQKVRESRLLLNAYDAWLLDEFRPYLGDRILEVGCGLGNLLSWFSDNEIVVGIETSQESVEHVRRLSKNNLAIQAFLFSITDSKVLELARLGFDTVISLNVFEHIQDDGLALEHVRQLLMPGGRFILIVPAHQSLYGKMDESIGHYRRYTKNSLRINMEAKGFQIIQQKYINMLGAIGWWFNGRVLKKEIPPEDQLEFINKLVPYLRRMENLMQAPFGISLLTVAQI